VAAQDDSWPLTGIDLSEFNTASLDGSELESSHDFWIHRATSGSRVDRLWKSRVLLASGLRIPFGGYAWTDQRAPIGPQVEAFLKALREAGCGSGWVRPVIDVEKPNSAPHFDAEWHRMATAILIDVLSAEYRCDPIIYGNRLELTQLGAGPWSRCPLWLAHYTTSPVTYPPPQWSRVDIWQHAANTYPTVPGGRSPAYGSGRVDVDLNRARALLTIP
jgi:lysozyme